MHAEKRQRTDGDAIGESQELPPQPIQISAVQTARLGEEVGEKLRQLNTQGQLQSLIDINAVIRPLSQLDSDTALEILESLQERGHRVDDPTNWVIEAAMAIPVKQNVRAAEPSVEEADAEGGEEQRDDEEAEEWEEDEEEEGEEEFDEEGEEERSSEGEQEDIEQNVWKSLDLFKKKQRKSKTRETSKDTEVETLGMLLGLEREEDTQRSRGRGRKAAGGRGKQGARADAKSGKRKRGSAEETADGLQPAELTSAELTSTQLEESQVDPSTQQVAQTEAWLGQIRQLGQLPNQSAAQQRPFVLPQLKVWPVQPGRPQMQQHWPQMHQQQWQQAPLQMPVHPAVARTPWQAGVPRPSPPSAAFCRPVLPPANNWRPPAMNTGFGPGQPRPTFKDIGSADLTMDQICNYKTRLCVKWAAGLCTTGDSCFLAHGRHELRESWRPPQEDEEDEEIPVDDEEGPAEEEEGPAEEEP